jgi:hypothetical protein
MSKPFLKWLRLPSRIALLCGLGALSAAAARADTIHQVPGGDEHAAGQNQRASSGDFFIWSEGERLCVSEDGNRAEELRLGDTVEAQHLRQLLQRHGSSSSGVRLDRMILAGGGGTGMSWGHSKPAGPDRMTNPPETGAANQTTRPKKMGVPQQSGAAANANSPANENKR